ncbi:MAG: cupin domain-containing protein [Polyangiaceae bacterium]|jgi:hypothetical protein|nr:cupin domain-containing protein [Polyangiaceae bacterium]
MLLNADLSLRALVDTTQAPRVPSPLPGVERVLLDRDGGEVARATSVVHYAPGSRFSAHEPFGAEACLFYEETGHLARG